MSSKQEVPSFIRATFRSVWSLEVLLHLKNHSDRGWTRPEMVSALRASELIVSHSVESLVAAGLVYSDDDGIFRYKPVSPDLERLVAQTEALYATSPNAVRRLIISSANSGLAAFADAFKLRKD